MVHLILRSSQFVALLEAFKTHLNAKGYKQGTKHSHYICVKELLYKLEENCLSEIRDINAEHIQEHYQYLMHRPKQKRVGALSSSMLSHHVYAWRTFFAWCERIEAIKLNPLAGLDFPHGSSPERIAFSQEEIKKLYQYAETPRDKALLGLYYACGLRRTEGVNVTMQDVDFNSNKLIVREGKFAKRGEIPLHPSVVTHFKEYTESHRKVLLSMNTKETPTQFLLNNLGMKMTGDMANGRVQYLAKQAGIKRVITLHHLRHTIATHLKENGMKLEQIKEYLGHSSLDVTQAYLEGYSIRWKRKGLPKYEAKTILYWNEEEN
jgi:integrase/recombinase XerD